MERFREQVGAERTFRPYPAERRNRRGARAGGLSDVRRCLTTATLAGAETDRRALIIPWGWSNLPEVAAHLDHTPSWVHAYWEWWIICSTPLRTTGTGRDHFPVCRFRGINLRRHKRGLARLGGTRRSMEIMIVAALNSASGAACLLSPRPSRFPRVYRATPSAGDVRGSLVTIKLCHAMGGLAMQLHMRNTATTRLAEALKIRDRGLAVSHLETSSLQGRRLDSCRGDTAAAASFTSNLRKEDGRWLAVTCLGSLRSLPARLVRSAGSSWRPRRLVHGVDASGFYDRRELLVSTGGGKRSSAPRSRPRPHAALWTAIFAGLSCNCSRPAAPVWALLLLPASTARVWRAGRFPPDVGYPRAPALAAASAVRFHWPHHQYIPAEV